VTIRPIRFLLFCLSLSLIALSCKRINEATDLGEDLLPGVDGVHTFDTTFTSLQTYNHITDPLKDSIRIRFAEDQILGNISGDPLFGKTNAKMFVQLKPATYPWSFSEVYDDSLYIDSVVLVLGWSGNYGDTVAPQKITVKEIDPHSDFRVDSFYTIYDPGPPTTTVLGTKTFSPQNLKDSVKVYKDTTASQLRIRLDNSFGQRLLDYDTVGAYRSDSIFSTYFKGFAIEADQSLGNALMAFSINNNPNTKLAIYYRYTQGGKNDTTVNYFLFKPGFSAYHDYVKRDFSSALVSASNSPGEDDPIYLINTPGSYATVKIPALRDLSNRIINRAELIVEQIYDPSNEKFTYPDALMLDVFDSTLNGYKFVPFDFLPSPETGFPNAAFGLYGNNTVDAAGRPIKIWKFNITRYVQNILTKQEPLHDFRLYISKDSYSALRQGVLGNTGLYTYPGIPINQRFAFGRVMVGGGQRATQTMRLRIVHTKI
jgi:hypothetical protein